MTLVGNKILNAISSGYTTRMSRNEQEKRKRQKQDLLDMSKPSKLHACVNAKITHGALNAFLSKSYTSYTTPAKTSIYCATNARIYSLRR